MATSKILLFDACSPTVLNKLQQVVNQAAISASLTINLQYDYEEKYKIWGFRKTGIYRNVVIEVCGDNPRRVADFCNIFLYQIRNNYTHMWNKVVTKYLLYMSKTTVLEGKNDQVDHSLL